MYKNRNNEIQEIGYKKNTNEFYQVFSNDHMIFLKIYQNNKSRICNF